MLSLGFFFFDFESFFNTITIVGMALLIVGSSQKAASSWERMQLHEKCNATIIHVEDSTVLHHDDGEADHQHWRWTVTSVADVFNEDRQQGIAILQCQRRWTAPPTSPTNGRQRYRPHEANNSGDTTTPRPQCRCRSQLPTAMTQGAPCSNRSIAVTKRLLSSTLSRPIR